MRKKRIFSPLPTHVGTDQQLSEVASQGKMCKSLIVVAGHDSIDKRSDDHRTVAYKSVTQPKTEILKPSVVSPIVQIPQLLWILMRKVACILQAGKRHAEIHG